MDSKTMDGNKPDIAIKHTVHASLMHETWMNN